MWLPFLYPPPASAFVAAVSVVSFASLASAGLSELRGEHMAYSKFWHVVAGRQQQQQKRAGGALLSSRDGMLVAYGPALVAAVASFAVPGAVELTGEDDVKLLVLNPPRSAPMLKVLFIHRYSGSMPLKTALTIFSSYLLSTVTMIYAQHLASGLPEPATDLLYPGIYSSSPSASLATSTTTASSRD